MKPLTVKEFLNLNSVTYKLIDKTGVEGWSEITTVSFILPAYAGKVQYSKEYVIRKGHKIIDKKEISGVKSIRTALGDINAAIKLQNEASRPDYKWVVNYS